MTIGSSGAEARGGPGCGDAPAVNEAAPATTSPMTTTDPALRDRVLTTTSRSVFGPAPGKLATPPAMRRRRTGPFTNAPRA